MTVPLYYAVRITLADKDNVSREVMRVDSVEQLNDRTHNIAPLGAKVETKFLGQGEPIYESRSPLRKRFRHLSAGSRSAGQLQLPGRAGR